MCVTHIQLNVIRLIKNYTNPNNFELCHMYLKCLGKNIHVNT